MRLPSARTAVGVYLAVFALASIPQFTNIIYYGPRWALVASSIPVILLPAALFAAAFSINRREVFALPVVALIGQTILVSLFSAHPKYDAPGLGMLTLRHDLWDTIKQPIPIALLVVAAALALARSWAPQAQGVRMEKPDPTGPAIAFAVALGLTLISDIARTRLGFYHGFAPGFISDVLGDAVAISFFVLCVAAFSVWLLPLPVFVVFESIVVIFATPGFSCTENICKEVLWPTIRDGLLVWFVLLAVSTAAGWWVRRIDGDEVPDQTSSFDPSITARSPGSEK